jgi:hypothetical protein
LNVIINRKTARGIENPMDITTFVAENPLNTEEIFPILEKFGVPPIIFGVGKKYHTVEITATYETEIITDHKVIGENFNERQTLESFLSQIGIPISFDAKLSNRNMKLSLKILINDKALPFDASQQAFYKLFNEQSVYVVRFLLLVIAYQNLQLPIEDHIQITRKEILDKWFDLQTYAGPTKLINKDAVFLKNQQLPQFAWGRPVTPLPPPSPIPVLDSLPPHLRNPELSLPPLQRDLEDPHTNDDKKQDADGFTRVGAGICRFDMFFRRGKDGINGRVLPDEEIYKNFTKRVLEKDKDVGGLETTDPIFRKEMNRKLGPAHFKEWEKFYPRSK